jgi:hypothetical protein
MRDHSPFLSVVDMIKKAHAPEPGNVVQMPTPRRVTRPVHPLRVGLIAMASISTATAEGLLRAKDAPRPEQMKALHEARLRLQLAMSSVELLLNASALTDAIEVIGTVDADDVVS